MGGERERKGRRGKEKYPWRFFLLEVGLVILLFLISGNRTCWDFLIWTFWDFGHVLGFVVEFGLFLVWFFGLLDSVDFLACSALFPENSFGNFSRFPWFFLPHHPAYSAAHSHPLFPSHAHPLGFLLVIFKNPGVLLLVQLAIVLKPRGFLLVKIYTLGFSTRINSVQRRI